MKNEYRRLQAAATFVEKSNNLHDHRYSYDQAMYTTATTKVVIECKEHGSFLITPNDHLRGKGCPTCGQLKQARTRRHAAATRALEVARELHGQKYDYSDVDLDIGVSSPVNIGCPIHGAFSQPLNQHKRHGCSQCGRDQAPGWYSKKRLLDYGISRVPTTVYLCNMWTTQERFVKFGITKLPMKIRMEEPSKHYNWETVSTLVLPAIDASELEKSLKRTFSDRRYIPKIKFGDTLNATILKSSIPFHLINQIY